MAIIVMSGLVGGLSIEALYWYSNRELLSNGIPLFARRYAYWISTIVMILFSGIIVWLYQSSGIELKPIVAFNIGASTPTIITAITKAVPPVVKID